MDHRRARMTAAGGIGFVVLLLISVFIVPQPPGVDKPLRDITGYYADHHDGLIASGLIGLLALPFFFAFLGGMRSILSSAEGEGAPAANAMFGAGMVVVAMAAVLGTALSGALVQRIAATGNEPAVRALYEVNQLIFATVSMVVAVLLAAGSWVILRTGVMARWLGWVGMAGAIVAAVGGCAGTLRDTSPVAILGFAGFLGFLLWTLIASVLLLLGHPERRASSSLARAAS